MHPHVALELRVACSHERDNLLTLLHDSGPSRSSRRRPARSLGREQKRQLPYCTKALSPKIRFLRVRGTEVVNGVSENVWDEATLVVHWLVRVRKEHREHPIERNEHKMDSKTRTIDSERGVYRRGKESQKAPKTRNVFAICSHKLKGR